MSDVVVDEVSPLSGDEGPVLPVLPVLPDVAPTLAKAPQAEMVPPPLPDPNNLIPSATTPVDVPEGMPVLPLTSPVLSSPQLPKPHTDNPETGVDDAGVSEPQHPMAHLMPEKVGPSEASRRAAETRAAKKAKSRKIKVGVAAGALVFAVVVGPPLARWFVDAINEAGSTSTEEPAEQAD